MATTFGQKYAKIGKLHRFQFCVKTRVCGLFLVVDMSVQSRYVRILSVSLVGSQTKSVAPSSEI